MIATNALILFSGPGGSTQGIRDAGITDTLSVEWDDSAVATARAAGHEVIQADVRLLDPVAVAAGLSTWPYGYLLLQGSPPCQGLSAAGKGKGREDLDKLFEAIRLLTYVAEAQPSARALSQVIEGKAAELAETCSDERSPLTFEVMRWIFALRPDMIALEQVPAALPIWQVIGEVLESWGYSVWTGNVQAEQYGVAQTRKRAILLASCVSEVSAPVPTHSKYHTRDPEKLDEGVLPWVSMAEALGWDLDGTMVSNYGSGGDPSNRGTRELTQPAPTVTSKIGRNKIHVTTGQQWYDAAGDLVKQERDTDYPAPAVTGNTKAWQVHPTHMGDVRNKNGCVRPMSAPSPTLTASMDNGNFQFINEEAASKGIRVSVQEAGVLQSFPAEYPWQGTKTKQYEQVGNAVPPLLQQALTEHLLACATESINNNINREGEAA